MKLTENNDLFQTIFDSASNGIALMQCLYNEKGRVEDFSILLFNAHTLNWIGDTDYKGKRYSDVFPFVKQTGILEKFIEVAETGITARFECYYAGEGMKHWFYFTAVKQGELLVVTTEDITERKQSEINLKNALETTEKQKRLYDSITDNTPDLVYVFDLSYRFTYANKALLTMWGKNAEDAIGRGLRENGYEEWHAQMHEREIDEIVATKKSIRGTVSFPHAELGSRIYDYILVPVLNQDGQVEVIAGTTRDITEIKRIEERFQQSENRYKILAETLEQQVTKRTRELQRSNEDLQQFAHVASHDLKEPIRKIKTFTGRLEDHLREKLDDTGMRFMQRIHVATDRMFAMIDGVLAYSTINAIQKKAESVNLNEVIRNIETDLEVALQKTGGTIEYQNLPTLEGAMVLLYQLFYNLINNSIKFAKTGVPPHISISSEVDNQDFYRITVTDNGIGFKPDHSEQIFETFTRLNPKDDYEGTGLGLSLCKKIVERHGGNIIAIGSLDKGATFVITLPLKQKGISI
ncbi:MULTISPECIES: ATP-binding protein [unclassified Arcicella]|uniref:sensor histidine kinase n=1 Tax=unclassified Arcicella TaxID=2644986 RepID=UPI00285FB35A|nr:MULTISPECIES: ATP-binding protein [unclassified Arcicella]MDR6560696.1 PAS domain S-box-containing protein [Arcicella sp. BE51]MDR6810580.1 PAS domain S-box-containing protein [Arcicella sp. BE140]MDR6821930.1 PAS domain S-box-containing protein [Arcicella sp. BE139]